jgi:hypothetical protein
MMELLRDPKRQLLLVTSAVAMLASGCSPPPPETEETQISVGMPTGLSSDPGKLTDSAIDPPGLSDWKAADSAANERDRTLVQTARDGSRRAEVVPTPSPDSQGKPTTRPEIVPTPKGIPVAGGDGEAGPDEDAMFGGPVDFRTWPEPNLALVITGQQHGYLEPCGCTGLDRQKGGVARRFTFMQQLRDQGWKLMPIDAGNQVRRFGRQAEIKLQQTAKALSEMDYQAVGFGPDDMRLGVGELLAVAVAENPEESMYLSANVVLIDPDLMPQYRVLERGGIKVGVTTVLDPTDMEVVPSDEILVNPPAESLKATLTAMNEDKPDFRIVTFFGGEDAAKELVRKVPGFDLVVVAGGYGEPLFQAKAIEGTDTQLILTGDKGMYVGLVGLYADGPMKYARVPLTHEFGDAPKMRNLMAEYQNQLHAVGLEGLGLKPIPHPSGRKFVGSAKCGECHTTAYEIWEGTPHFDATASIVKPPRERGDVARHFDPECISCHVTGWNPQNYYPYASGYLSLEESDHLTGSGCENCHGPGLEHSTAEIPDSGVSEERLQQLRDQMKLPLDNAREKCMECHDLDNSPDFHEEDAFEDVYWPEVEHYGLD